MNLRLEDAIEKLEDMASDSKQLSDMISFLRNVHRAYCARFYYWCN